MKKALVAFAVALLALLAGAAWLSRAADGHLPPDVAVAGVQLGGHSLDEADRLLRGEAQRRAREPIVFTWRGGRLAVSGEQLGAEPLIASALDEARESRGRLSRLAARLGLTETRTIPLGYRFDRRALGILLEHLEAKLARSPRPASLEFRGEKLALVRSQAGRAVHRKALAAALAFLPKEIEVPLLTVRPRVREQQALAARAVAERLLEGPPAVIYKTTRADLDAAFLRRALRFEPLRHRLAVRLDAELLERRLVPVFRDYEREPRDAGFAIVGERVAVVPGQAGLTLDVRRIAREIVAHAGERQLLARLRGIAPAFTTREAERLRIRELVSEFTTPYACCAPRVTNIERAAAILDGTIIPAGGRFSLNEALGPRTRERGFVEAPMILRGRLVDAVGGGVSQVATTVYNAAFFAGLHLVEHMAHEFYISRYPMGREATVSWRVPDLVFRNDWPAAILVKVSAGSTAITVRFYSTELGRRVETETGEPHGYTAPRTRTIRDKSLPPGTKKVVQHGGVSGFTVSYTRRVYRGEKLLRKERWTVRYRPEDTIVEVGPRKPKPKPKQAPVPDLLTDRSAPPPLPSPAPAEPGSGPAEEPPAQPSDS